MRPLARVFELDARSLGAMRIALGAVLVADLVQRLSSLEAHYTDSGVLPRALEAPIAAPAHWTLLDVSGSPAYCAAVFVVALAAAAALAAGYRTRLATAASWLLLTSIHNRNALVLNSGDALLRLALFWGMFLPLGERFSCAAPRERAPRLSAGTVFFVVQMLFFFGFLLDHKLLGRAWTAGTAVGDAVSVGEYRGLAGGWLFAHPQWSPALTYAVLAVQAAVPLCLLVPAAAPWPRLVAVVLTLLTQVGFGLTFRLGLFPFITAAVMLAFVPADVWRWLGVPDESAAAEPAVPSWRARVVAAAGSSAMVLASLWNLGEAGATFVVGGTEVAFKDTALGRVALAFRLDQRWAMFAPNPQTQDGWFVLVARTANGEVVDLLPCLWECPAGPPPLDWRTPPSIADTFGPHRWAMLLIDLAQEPKPAAIEGLAGYGCRRWNAQAPPARRAESVDVVFVGFEHLPDRTTTAAQRMLLGGRRC